MDLIERIAQFKYDSIRLKNLGSTKKANLSIGFFLVAGTGLEPVTFGL
jgi:hypothetical protein